MTLQILLLLLPRDGLAGVDVYESDNLHVDC
jgi:hypothetical protein